MSDVEFRTVKITRGKEILRTLNDALNSVNEKEHEEDSPTVTGTFEMDRDIYESLKKLHSDMKRLSNSGDVPDFAKFIGDMAEVGTYSILQSAIPSPALEFMKKMTRPSYK